VPAATKAAAVGIGAVALMGGGDLTLTPHHAAKRAARSVEHHPTQARLHHATEPAAPAEHRTGFDERNSPREHSRSHDSQGSRRMSDDREASSSSSSGEGSSDGGDDRGGTATVTPQPTTDGQSSGDGDRTTSTSTGSDGGSGSSGSDGSDGSHDSGSSGSDGSSDGGSGGSGDGGSTSGPGG
jgi:hypothetical protein